MSIFHFRRHFLLQTTGKKKVSRSWCNVIVIDWIPLIRYLIDSIDDIAVFMTEQWKPCSNIMSKTDEFEREKKKSLVTSFATRTRDRSLTAGAHNESMNSWRIFFFFPTLSRTYVIVTHDRASLTTTTPSTVVKRNRISSSFNTFKYSTENRCLKHEKRGRKWIGDVFIEPYETSIKYFRWDWSEYLFNMSYVFIRVAIGYRPTSLNYHFQINSNEVELNNNQSVTSPFNRSSR